MTADEVFEEDARAYAELHGLGIDEARRRFAAEASFAAEVTRIGEQYPNKFVVSRVDHANDRVGTILLSGEIREDLGRRFEAQGLAVNIRTDAPMPAADLLARLDDVQQSLINAGYSEVVGVPDLERGTVHYEVEVPPSQRAMTNTRRRAALPVSARAPDVSVSFVEENLGELEAVYGGANTSNSKTNTKCTTGFTVKRKGVSGFITAGHCSNDRDVWDHSVGIEVNAPFRAQHRGKWGDFQWHTSSRHEGPRFYSDWGKLRNMAARNWPSLDQTLCVFGRASGRKCHKVYKIGVDNSTGGITHRKLVAVHRHVTKKGDSGGPWYASNYGYGVHHGWRWIGVFKRSLFSQARYMDEALGVVPKTR